MFVLGVDIGYSNLKLAIGQSGSEPKTIILPAGAGSQGPAGIFLCALSANRTSKLDLYCQVGLQVGLVLPSWAPNWTCTANLGSNLASKWLSRALQTFNFARQYGTLATFLQIGLYALQVLLDYFLAAVDTFLGAFWAQLGVS